MRLNNDAALVLLSGGQDSTTCLFWAKHNFKQVYALTFNYGQRHAIELQAAQSVANMANVDTYTVDVRNILLSTSPLIDFTQNLETYSSFEEMTKIIGDRVEHTFVPMRNLLLLVIAANRAIALEAANLVIGVCESDTANYPDCRLSFVQKAQHAINEALGSERISIHAPLISSNKTQTVELAKTLPGCMDALAYSHTCYAGTFPPCGKCHSCVLRAEGFRRAQVEDPLIVRARAWGEVVSKR